LLELSGLKAQLAGIASRLAGQLQPTQGQMSLKDQTAVDRILARAVSHDKIYALVRDELRRDVDRVRLEATVAWLRSPVARKIAALEVASSEPATEQKIGVYAAGLKANPPPAPRVELLQKLDWISAPRRPRLTSSPRSPAACRRRCLRPRPCTESATGPDREPG